LTEDFGVPQIKNFWTETISVAENEHLSLNVCQSNNLISRPEKSIKPLFLF
jgi:hypothetical protein